MRSLGDALFGKKRRATKNEAGTEQAEEGKKEGDPMASEPERDLYEILQVHESAHMEVIQAAYRRLTLLYHPDRNDSTEAPELMRELNRAYEVLSDPSKRNEYDSSRTPRPERWTSETSRTEHAPRGSFDRWQTWEEIDELSREREAYARLSAQDNIDHYLALSTSPNWIFIMVSFGEFLTSNDEIAVQYRIGDGGIEEDYWPTSSDGESVLVPSDKKDQFVRRMSDARELVARVFPDFGGVETAVFDLEGFEEVWQRCLRPTFERR